MGQLGTRGGVKKRCDLGCGAVLDGMGSNVVAARHDTANGQRLAAVQLAVDTTLVSAFEEVAEPGRWPIDFCRAMQRETQQRRGEGAGEGKESCPSPGFAGQMLRHMRRAATEAQNAHGTAQGTGYLVQPLGSMHRPPISRARTTKRQRGAWKNSG